jgi:lipoate-protein ligase A
MPADSAARNMAADDALLAACADGGPPSLRLYRWAAAALSFGRTLQVDAEVRVCECRCAGVELVRRPTGGGVVVHDGCLTFSVALPLAGAVRGLGEWRRRMGDALASGLQRLGVGAGRLDDGALAPDGLPNWCLIHPVRHDVVVSGRKVAGGALRRRRAAILYQAYVSVQPPRDAVLSLACSRDVASLVRRYSTSLEEAAGCKFRWREVAEAVMAGFAEVFRVPLVEGSLTVAERDRLDLLADALYRRDPWNLGDPLDRRRVRGEVPEANALPEWVPAGTRPWGG